MALETVSGRKHPSLVQVKQLKYAIPLMPILRHFVTSAVKYMSKQADKMKFITVIFN